MHGPVVAERRQHAQFVNGPFTAATPLPLAVPVSAQRFGPMQTARPSPQHAVVPMPMDQADDMPRVSVEPGQPNQWSSQKRKEGPQSAPARAPRSRTQTTPPGSSTARPQATAPPAAAARPQHTTPATPSPATPGAPTPTTPAPRHARGPGSEFKVAAARRVAPQMPFLGQKRRRCIVRCIYTPAPKKIRLGRTPTDYYNKL